MVMFGDETWLKLFLGLFTHDRISSFLVKDTAKVDHNVSRHLSYELFKSDWNLLIRFFVILVWIMLGIVVGALGTTYFNFIQLHANKTSVLLLISVLVVVSDHGMQENGNDGGSSYEETLISTFYWSKNHSVIHMSPLIMLLLIRYYSTFHS
ncbi:hypothetical protein LXL04_039635 [Taraxacum kok-saghyz]